MCISDAEHIVAAFMLQEICPCNFVLCCGRCNLITLRTAHTIHNECKREWTRKWWQRKNVVYAHASSSCTERWKNKQRSKLILEWASKTALGRYMYKTRINDEWWFRQDELQRWIDTRNWNWLLEFQMKNKKKRNGENVNWSWLEKLDASHVVSKTGTIIGQHGNAWNSIRNVCCWDLFFCRRRQFITLINALLVHPIAV